MFKSCRHDRSPIIFQDVVLCTKIFIRLRFKLAFASNYINMSSDVAQSKTVPTLLHIPQSMGLPWFDVNSNVLFLFEIGVGFSLIDSSQYEDISLIHLYQLRPLAPTCFNKCHLFECFLKQIYFILKDLSFFKNWTLFCLFELFNLRD
jgi:hypothetical protein